MKPQQVVQIFYKFSGFLGRVRVGQIKIENMCSLGLLDTKTGVDTVGGQAGNPRALASENSHFVSLFPFVFVNMYLFYEVSHKTSEMCCFKTVQ
jgi:hypothetical protein